MLELGRSGKVTFLLSLPVFDSGLVGTGGKGAFRLGCTLVLGRSAGFISTRRGGRTLLASSSNWSLETSALALERTVTQVQLVFQ